jgi:hypothetical protein
MSSSALLVLGLGHAFPSWRAQPSNIRHGERSAAIYTRHGERSAAIHTRHGERSAAIHSLSHPYPSWRG